MEQETGRDDVRNRLLDAAEKLFCEKGFDGTSIRELTTEADCNLAAVNYHFGNKDNLYIEMFRRQFEMMIERNLQLIDQLTAESGLTLEKLLRAMIMHPMRGAYEDQPEGQVLRLLVREILSQKLDRQAIVKDMKNKMFDRLGDVLKQLVPGLPDDRLLLMVCSFDGVVIHPFLFMDMYKESVPGLTLDQLLDHMVKFVASAIRGYADASQKGGVSCD
jgi:AcrR family transcriptional regulator